MNIDNNGLTLFVFFKGSDLENRFWKRGMMIRQHRGSRSEIADQYQFFWILMTGLVKDDSAIFILMGKDVSI